METSGYWVWLSHVATARQSRALLERFGTPECLFESAKKRDGAFNELKPQWRERLSKYATEGYVDSIFERLERLGVRAVTQGDDEYPPLLLEIYDPPTTLYVKGASLAHEKTVAIVGSRRPTRYGLECARHFGFELARRGLCVVSGLARGIDATAHLAALESDSSMPTMAVLGSGVDIPSPPSSEPVYDQIAKRGALISEFVPGTPPIAANFPARNRIISGLSLGVLVIEAAERSGTHITVSSALDQGREVLAVPGRITDRMSAGTNAMLKSYAHVATSVQDVIDALGFELIREYEAPKELLGDTEKAIVTRLLDGEKSPDELAELLDEPISALNSALTLMEFRGIIRQLPGRLFALPLK